MVLNGRSSLRERLARALPDGHRFTIHHISTPPTRSRPLYAAPPGELAEETYCESHFLSLSIVAEGNPVQVFGIEVLIYSTQFLTTLFVSKADSTGYLHLLNLPPGIPSPLKQISLTFLQYLVRGRRRSDRRLVLSLFARAQNQYLFPGSIENSHKHVLDDRGLIKWWCKVVDPLLGAYPDDSGVSSDKRLGVAEEEPEVRSHGFLRVPGCDKYETRTFLPRIDRGRKPDGNRWHTSDPLRELGKSPDLPERCLIPRFPDDPKARFVEQLDEELPGEDSQRPESKFQDSGASSNSRDTGQWRSVKSMEQFWDMMSYRQECSSGRLVGFLWAVFQPSTSVGAKAAVDGDEGSRYSSQAALPTPEISQQHESALLPPQSPLRSSPVPDIPTTPSRTSAAPSQHTPAPTPQKVKDVAIQSQPEETRFYYWPKSSRGEVVLRQKDYQRAGNLMLRLDYENLEVAKESTKKWITDIAERASIRVWGHGILGLAPIAATSAVEQREADPVFLNAGLVRKKKRPIDEVNGHTAEIKPGSGGLEANTLATGETGLIRKKAKVAD